MSQQAGNGTRRPNNTPLELLQEWSAQLEQNEAQLRVVKTNLARRQLQRKGSKQRRPALGALQLGAEEEGTPAPGIAPPTCQPGPGARARENVLLGPAANGGASASKATSPTLNSSSCSKKPFGHPLRYPSQSSPLQSLMLQPTGGGGLFGDASDVSPARTPGLEPLGHAEAHALHASPTRMPSPAASQCALADTEQRGQATPLASPSQLPASRLASSAVGQRMPARAQLQGRGTPSTSPCPPVSPAKLQSPAAVQGALGAADGWGHAATHASPGQLRRQATAQRTPGSARCRLDPASACPPQQQQEGCAGQSSSKGLRHTPAQPRESGWLGGAAPTSSKAGPKDPSASPSKLAVDPCPLQLAATQMSPIGLGDFRIKAMSASKSERSRVTFQQEAVVGREDAGGSADNSEEELFFSAAPSAEPSRTTSLRAFPALASGQVSPTTSTNTVLQRLERTADTLAAVAAAAAAAGQVDDGGNGQGSEEAGGEASGGLKADDGSPSVGAAAGQLEQQAEGWLGRGCRSPSALLGMFGSRVGGTPGRGEGAGSAASSPIRQRLLSGPATLLGALGWGRRSQQEEAGPGPSSKAGGQEGKEQLATQPSLPSNPFDMLAADDSCGGDSVAASPAGLAAALDEVQSARVGAALGAGPAANTGPTPQSLRKQYQRPPALGAEALRSSEVGSSWEGAGGSRLPTPNRLAASKDNPLYDPFGSSFVPAAGSPDKARQGGPPVTLFLGRALQSGDSLVLQGSLTEQGAAVGHAQLSPGGRRQLRRQEEPGSAGSFAARQGTLEPVLEQANEGESSPDGKLHMPRAPQWPQSLSFTHLEQQAETWAEVQKIGWEAHSVRLPPAIAEEERDEFEASIQVVCASPEQKAQAAEGAGGTEPAAAGAGPGEEAGTPVGDQPLPPTRDAANNSALWQTGLAMVGGAMGAVMGAVLGRGQGLHGPGTGLQAEVEDASMGPLGQALTCSQQQRLEEQRLQRPQGSAGASASLSAGSMQPPLQQQHRSSPFDAASAAAAARQGSAVGLGVLAVGELEDPKVEVDAAYTMPLGFSLLRSQQEVSLGPQRRQQQRQRGSARFIRQASPPAQGRATSFGGEPRRGPRVGRSISSKDEAATAAETLPSAQATVPAPGSEAALFATEAAAGAAFQSDLHSSSESALLAAEAAAFIAGGPSRRAPFGTRQPQGEQQQRTPEGSPVRPGVGIAGASPADVFKRGLTPLKVQFDQQEEGPPSASVLKAARPHAPHRPARQHPQQPWDEGAQPLGPPQPQPASPDVGRARPQGKRYSPESLQYKERLKHQGEVISSLYLRRQLSSSQERLQQAQGLRDSASFHTAQATIPRSLQQQQHSTQDRGPAGTQPSGASPTPLSKLRPADGSQRAAQGEGSKRFCAPQASMQSSNPRASQQGAGGAPLTPGEAPAMTPITAINTLRGMAHGSAWEGQQQQMQSILSRLESRVRETRTRAKTEAERRVQLEQQVADLEAKMTNLAREAVQASTLKQELSGVQQELEQLREENLRLQREREACEAELAAEQQRVQAQRQPQAAAPPRPTRGGQFSAARFSSHPFPAAAPAPANGVQELPPQQQSQQLSPQEPYPAKPPLVPVLGPRLPAPPAPHSTPATLRAGGGWECSAFTPPGRSGAMPSNPERGPAVPAAVPVATAPPDAFAMPAMDTMPAPNLARYPDPYAPAAPQQAERGRWSNGSVYSDPTTELWQSMAPQQQQQQQPQLRQPGWQDGATLPRGVDRHAPQPGWQHHTWDQGTGGAGYQGQTAQPPQGSTWGPPATPHGRSLQRLLHVAGDSSMFRPLYTGAQQMVRSPRYGTF